MRFFGRNISRWWLIAAPPVLLMLLPGMLMLFFFGNNLAGAVFGPPAIWNRPWDSPQRADMFGTYLESRRNLDQAVEFKHPAVITLRDDGSMIVSDLPTQSELSGCTVSAKGFWGGPWGDTIDIRFMPSQDKRACDRSEYWSIQIASRSKPYRLYMPVGDPDSGTGIWFEHK